MKAAAFAMTAFLASTVYADDILLPPMPYAPHSAETTIQELPQPVNPNELITLDVLVLYTPGLAATFGDDLSDQLTHFITVANEAYRESAVNIHLRAIHTQEVIYTDKSSNTDALRAMTNESHPAFLGISQLRNDAKADLVVLIRPFRYPVQESCGAAWLLGSNGRAQIIYKQANYAYSVVSFGESGGYACRELSFVHELGHNMGLTHDKLNAPQKGAFPYAYGYQVPGLFGTIMSYGRPRIARFSSPIQYCMDQQFCGVEDTDNVRALNEIRQTIANFRN